MVDCRTTSESANCATRSNSHPAEYEETTLSLSPATSISSLSHLSLSMQSIPDAPFAFSSSHCLSQGCCCPVSIADCIRHQCFGLPCPPSIRQLRDAHLAARALHLVLEGLVHSNGLSLLLRPFVEIFLTPCHHDLDFGHGFRRRCKRS